MKHAELIDRVQDDAWAMFWPDPASWRNLVELASAESGDPMPISAALWEALWRTDPGVTPERWATEGPQPPEVERLNPFLTSELFGDARSVGYLARLDIRAADLLEAALQAEGVPQWWRAPQVVDGYLDLRMESARFVATLTGELYATDLYSGDRPADSEPTSAPDDLANRVDDYEVALTRLLLVGHPDTTQRILPVLLEVRGATSSAPVIEQIRLTEFAMSRLRLRQRPMAGARTAARVSRRTEPVLDSQKGARSRLGSLAAVFVGTAFGAQSARRSRVKTKSGAPA